MKKNTCVDIKSKHTVLKIQLLKKQQILDSIQRLKLIAAAIVIFTIFIAYAQSASSTLIFISLLAFMAVQLFATQEYVQLAKLARRIRLINGGSYFPCNQVHISWKIAAGTAIKDSYFLLLFFFDVSWLSHAYLYPSPAGSFHQFLIQLSFGPISGTFFIWFTVLLWVVYMYLFIIGLLYSYEINFPEQVNSTPSVNNKPAVKAREVWIKIKTYDHNELYLLGNHLSNPGRQTLILSPGLFQNGYVYHLSEEVSLALFLWQNNFDTWIVHPRGTAQSEGRNKRSSLDDFASDDIPAIVNYVFGKTGIKPVFVGHSQGGITAIISMMGAQKKENAKVILSDAEMKKRQENLKALVTLGSFLDCTFSKESGLKKLVTKGINIPAFGSAIQILRSQTLLKTLQRFNFIAAPLSFKLRTALLQSTALKILLFPVTVGLHFFSLLPLWEFLYHIPNLDSTIRKRLVYKTMDGTFSPIISQFYEAIASGQMKSVNGKINYSQNYQRITLPVSIVAMELDALADPVMMKQNMFDVLSSETKFFTVWKGVGHEDHFTTDAYFPLVLAAIKKVC